MNYKLVIFLWTIFAISIVYWDMQRWEEKDPISICHNVEVQIYKDKYLCTKCEKWCEIKK